MRFRKNYNQFYKNMEYIEPILTTATQYGPSMKYAADIWLTYKYDYQYLEKEIEYASKYIQILKNQISKFEMLQKKYNIEICSIEKGKKFLEEFDELIKSFETSKNIFLKTQQTASKLVSVNWYRDQIHNFLMNFNIFINLIKQDVKLFKEDIEYLKNIKNKDQRNKYLDDLKSIYSC
jgi:hypothetical protein